MSLDGAGTEWLGQVGGCSLVTWVLCGLRAMGDEIGESRQSATH